MDVINVKFLCFGLCILCFTYNKDTLLGVFVLD